MKKVFLLSLVIFLLFLDLTALIDILSGNEPSLTGEFLTIFISLPILFVIGSVLRKKKSP